MGRAPTLIAPVALLLAFVAGGCGEKPADKAAQTKDVFAGTDTTKLTPAQKAAIDGIERANAASANK